MARHLTLTILLALGLALQGCAASAKKPEKLSVDLANSAMTSYQTGDFEEAVRQYEVLTAQVPGDAGFWFYLGNSYAKSQRPQSAILAYQNALLRDKTMGKAWYNLGLVHMQQALKAYVDMETNVPDQDPVRQLGREKMEGLFQLLGKSDTE